jgi:hypothetical protein
MKTIGLGMLFAASAVLGACGGGGDDMPADGAVQPRNCSEVGGDACFEHPTVAATLDDNTTLANWACPPEAPATSAAPFMVSGHVNDFQEGTPLVGATVEAFLSATDFSVAPVATATTDSTGAYSFTLPMSTPNRMAWRITHPDALDTYEINDPIDVAAGDLTNIDRNSVSQDTADALPAFIGVNRTPGLGVLAGAIRDCDREPVMHAIATISSTSSAGTNAQPTFVPGAQVYYFSGGASLSLPVQRTIRTDSNKDGLFVIIEIPPTSGSQTYFLQIWGFKSAADVTSNMLSLVSEFETKVVGDSVIVVDMDPTEGQ